MAEEGEGSRKFVVFRINRLGEEKARDAPSPLAAPLWVSHPPTTAGGDSAMGGLKTFGFCRLRLALLPSTVNRSFDFPWALLQLVT